MRKSPARKRFAAALLFTAGLSCVSTFGQKPAESSRELKDAATSTPAATLQAGPYYALVIGNNDYRFLGKLQTAVHDATAVANLLRQRYGFAAPKLLLNATRDDILTALTEYRRTLPENSNLLIYFSGHSYRDQSTTQAYWLPVDARADISDQWVSADDVGNMIRAIASKHVLIISDGAFSGVLTRDHDIFIDPSERHVYLARVLESKSRTVMSSGGFEPCADVGPGGHSVFANAILKGLTEIKDEQFTANELSRLVQRDVAGHSEQIPLYSIIRNTGHEFGDFVFTQSPLEVPERR